MTKTIISRSDARDAGLKLYFTGKPCPHGHIAQRRVANTVCIECASGSAQQREAQRAGLLFYNTGRPCKYGHRADRYSSNGGCVECLKISDLEQNKRISAERLVARIARTPVPAVIQTLYQGDIVSRKDAKAAGTLRFFTGKPCVKGHIDQRLVSSNGCMECNRLAANEAHLRDPEAHSARSRIYRLNNIEKVRISMRVHSRNRHAVKRNAEGKHTNAEINILHAAQQGRCANPVCGKVLGNTYHADHIVALINGGSNWIENIQLLCPTCNLRKGRKDYSQFVVECLERLAA